ncbi:MAG: tetratricopeptide repeat protein [Thermoguttaceae bacterium]
MLQSLQYSQPEHQQWAHGHGDWNKFHQEWLTHHPDWDHHGDWWRHGHGGWWWGPWWDWDAWWWPGPYWNYWAWYPWDYPYWNYGEPYCYGYGGIAPYANYNPWESQFSPDDQGSTLFPEEQPLPPSGEMGGRARASNDYYAPAEEAFRQRDYRQALRLAEHATVEDPRDARAHLLVSLAAFAQGDYRPAAVEAHAAAALGPVIDWATLYGLYGDVAAYSKQLRALENFVGKNPSAAEARFLLALHYMMGGHNEAARVQFAAALSLSPDDALAAALAKQLAGPAAK